MADKAWCPGCDSYTSDLLQGLRQEGKCPYCGLSAEVIHAVERAQKHNVEEEITRSMVAAEKRVVQLEQRNSELEAALRRVSESLRVLEPTNTD